MGFGGNGNKTLRDGQWVGGATRRTGRLMDQNDMLVGHSNNSKAVLGGVQVKRDGVLAEQGVGRTSQDGNATQPQRNSTTTTIHKTQCNSSNRNRDIVNSSHSQQNR